MDELMTKHKELAYRDAVEIVKAVYSSGSSPTLSGIADCLQKTYDKLKELQSDVHGGG